MTFWLRRMAVKWPQNLLLDFDVTVIDFLSLQAYLKFNHWALITGNVQLDHSLFSSPPVWPGLRGHALKVLQGPSRRLRRKPILSVRVVKLWNRLSTSIVAPRASHTWYRMQGCAVHRGRAPLTPLLLLKFPITWVKKLTRLCTIDQSKAVNDARQSCFSQSRSHRHSKKKKKLRRGCSVPISP